MWTIESPFAFSATANDTLAVADIFGDHMVLQRNEKVTVWGTAEANENVTIQFISRKYQTVTDDRGQWMIIMDAVDAGGPYDMMVSGKNTQVRFEDVFMGDVWLASGQSNMAFRFQAATDPDKENAIANAGNHNIRTYEVAKLVAGSKLLNEDDKPWSKVTPENVNEWSAVAFYFARGLYTHLNVPIGIINCNQGGSTIEAWMSAGALQEARVPEHTYPGILSHYKNPVTLYKAMLSGIIPFTLKGVIWYQGESNAHAPEDYEKLFGAMIRQWRAEWNDNDLPFLFAQLPDFGRREDKTGDSWARLRQSQEAVTASLPNTAMVVLIDAGDKNDIHPTNKRVVGERLVLAARAVAYGENVGYSGPAPDRIRYKKGQAIISYDHAPDGLVMKGDTLQGFEIRDRDGKWHPANARLAKDRVQVAHPVVKEISGVRYAWANAPDVNLYNRKGLPARPFTRLKTNEVSRR